MIRLLAVMLLGLMAFAAPSATAQPNLQALLASVFPEASAFGPVEGNPPAAAAYRDGRLVGYVFHTLDVVGSTGYSGKPLNIAVGMNLEGRIVGAKLTSHAEPILVLGINPIRLEEFVAGHRNLDIRAPVRAEKADTSAGSPDIIAGATVSSLLLREAIIRAGRAIARSRGLFGAAAAATVELDAFEPKTWLDLASESAIVRLRFTGSEIAFRLAAASMQPATDIPPDGLFADLYLALVTPAGIGRNILADRDFGRLMSATTPGDHWLLLAANGLYSFKGTAFVRGGTFDRIQLVQGEKTIRFQRDDYRLVEALPAGQPNFREMGLFRVPKDAGFDATKPWRLEFAVPALGLDGSPRSLRLELDYTLPKRFIRLPPTMEPEVQVQRQVISTSSPDLWQATWLANMGKITITIIALSAMMVVLILQDQIVRRPELYRWLRNGFLAFTLVWLGWYAIAQLSVVNVVTFVHALLSGFRWDFFLLEPVIFLEWSFVALALLFWGRGVFCGWLCPFGALQELTHYLARLLRLPQFQVNFLIHERLWAVKYVLFLVILALSLNFTEIAIAAAEVEPFKTAVAMRFVRSWPFLIYAMGLLVAGLFVERFFCRYLCPLGAAIAIPARIRMFEWLKRRPQCGSQCQACAQKCPVQAIHPDGKINPNECIYCLNCQMLHYNDRVCPPLVERRQKREARAAKLKELMAKPATATEAKA